MFAFSSYTEGVVQNYLPFDFEPTDEQRRAIEHLHGPMLVVAGAGTGKTTVLARRIAHLIESVVVEGLGAPKKGLCLPPGPQFKHLLDLRRRDRASAICLEGSGLPDCPRDEGDATLPGRRAPVRYRPECRSQRSLGGSFL